MITQPPSWYWNNLHDAVVTAIRQIELNDGDEYPHYLEFDIDSWEGWVKKIRFYHCKVTRKEFKFEKVSPKGRLLWIYDDLFVRDDGKYDLDIYLLKSGRELRLSLRFDSAKVERENKK